MKILGSAKVSHSIQEHCRLINFTELESINIFRIDDIVFTDGDVPIHKDGTMDGKNTVILVLVNDGDCWFLHDNECFQIPVGYIFRFDGNKDHTLVDIYRNLGKGRFAGIIWDVEIEIEDSVVMDMIIDRLNELNFYY